MGLSLAKQLMSPQKIFVSSAKFTKSLVIIIEIGYNLDCSNIQKHGEWASCKTINMIRVKGSERRPFSITFCIEILFCTIHIRQMKLSWKLRNGNKKFQATMSKALEEFY